MSLGGARPNLFQVELTNPILNIGDVKMTFMARASQLPSWNLGIVNVPYFGRSIKLPGNRTFDPWTVTVYNDEDMLVRNALETWSNAMNSVEGNIAVTGSSPATIKSQGTVTQFGKDGTPIRIYQFNGVWPSTVAAIDLNWEANDQIEEFQVTFQYDDLLIIGGTTGNAGSV